MQVHLVKTGVANVASVTAALERLGAEVTVTGDPAAVATARAVVLPGVGSFGAGMQSLKESGLSAALRTRIHGDQPTLAICLGLQLLTRSSDETPGARGLGVLPITSRRLDGAPRLPHFGWNRVRVEAPVRSADPSPAKQAETILRDGDAYFAHTYCLRDAAALRAAGWLIAETQEGTNFVSAVERGTVVACQFHPELSGAYGAGLLGRWLARAEAAPRAEARSAVSEDHESESPEPEVPTW